MKHNDHGKDTQQRPLNNRKKWEDNYEYTFAKKTVGCPSCDRRIAFDQEDELTCTCGARSHIEKFKDGTVNVCLQEEINDTKTVLRSLSQIARGEL